MYLCWLFSGILNTIPSWVQALKQMTLFLKDIYLFGSPCYRKRGKEWKREIFHSLNHSHIGHMARAGLGRSQEPGYSCGSLLWTVLQLCPPRGSWLAYRVHFTCRKDGFSYNSSTVCFWSLHFHCSCLGVQFCWLYHIFLKHFLSTLNGKATGGMQTARLIRLLWIIIYASL